MVLEALVRMCQRSALMSHLVHRDHAPPSGIAIVAGNRCIDVVADQDRMRL
jgi:hypothetical protein